MEYKNLKQSHLGLESNHLQSISPNWATQKLILHLPRTAITLPRARLLMKLPFAQDQIFFARIFSALFK